VKVAVKLMEYDTPKLKSVEIQVDEKEKETMIFKIAGQEIPFEKVS